MRSLKREDVVLTAKQGRIPHCAFAYCFIILSTPVSVLYDGWVGRVRHKRECLEIAWGCPLACLSNLITMQVGGGIKTVLIVMAIVTCISALKCNATLTCFRWVTVILMYTVISSVHF